MLLKKVWFVSLLLLRFPGVAQQVCMTDLLNYLQSPVEEFERCMLRQGFSCYQSSRYVWGWTCLFAYQPIAFPAPPEKAMAIIQYDRSSRSAVLTYQIRSARQYSRLQREMAALGYRMQSAPGDRCIFSRGNTVITCRQTDQYTGISGNYGGHTITLIRQRY